MKKLMIASLVALMMSGAALADCSKCQQGAQANKSCCQQSQGAKTGWFSSGSAACTGNAAACPGKQANQQCPSCKEKAQGQAPSGGSSEAKEQSGGCCQQKK